MYSGVPQKVKDSDSSVKNGIEIPKSVSLICPSESMRTLVGFKSLYKMFLEWRCSKATIISAI
jgi:hypothetical protein